MYVAVSGADKAVYLLDFFSGECIAKLWGHSGNNHMIVM